MKSIHYLRLLLALSAWQLRAYRFTELPEGPLTPDARKIVPLVALSFAFFTVQSILGILVRLLCK